MEEGRILARGWVLREDFLLEPTPYLSGLGDGVGFIVGNPPYLRLEQTDPAVAESYRKLFKTIAGRASPSTRRLSACSGSAACAVSFAPASGC